MSEPTPTTFAAQFGYVTLRREEVINDDGSINVYGWSEHYDRDGLLKKTTPKELLCRVEYD